MNLDLNRIAEKIENNEFIKKFMKELSKALEGFSQKKELRGEKMDDIKLTRGRRFRAVQKAI